MRARGTTLSLYSQLLLSMNDTIHKELHSKSRRAPHFIRHRYLKQTTSGVRLEAS